MEPKDLDDQLERLHKSAEAATSEGLFEEALKHCENALELIDLHADEDTDHSHADFLMLAGNACWAAGNIESAQRYYRQALDLEPGRRDAMVAVGVSLFHLCRFEAARQQLEIVSAEDPEIGEVWYYLALLALRRDDRELADLFFHRAHEHEEERWSVPEFLPIEEIEALLNEMFVEMPEEIREALANVPIIVEERPSEAMLHAIDPPFDPLLLGVFEGTPMTETSVFTPELAPTRIVIFAENIALIAADKEELREELWITMKHEIGHFFGLDEDDLAARGLD